MPTSHASRYERFLGFSTPEWLAMATIAAMSYYIVDMADGSPHMPDCPACHATGEVMHAPWCPFGYVPAKVLAPFASTVLLAVFFNSRRTPNE